MDERTQGQFRLHRFTASPLQQQLLVLLAAIVLLIPIVALVVLGVVVFGVWQLARIALGAAPPPGARASTADAAPGPVIDVEVTRRDSA